MRKETWLVIIDFFTDERTYGVYATEKEAKQAAAECRPARGEPKIRRAP